MARSPQELIAVKSNSQSRQRCFASCLSLRLLLLCGLMSMAGCGEAPSPAAVEQDDLERYLEEHPEAREVSAEDINGF
ncbi:hypothetical protein LF1_24520 [Rubripirellula obstinata]|uniref:Secreted protein n=1 Tax=Rubripirellula obstinata TaxID=406547 RepID=A0A5B1CJ20_9BACT|nr:hypothetical protein [Rubripirellula obstinata]KAA1259915.1 hypothetical protein LF1_24520 [Rubripirellula obstinata]